MVKELIHDPFLLSQKSKPAAAEDLQIAVDLEDTLRAHRETCVGMAANMIGAYICIICVQTEDTYKTMLNPKIIKQSGAYKTEEGCLSLLGTPRPVRRYQKIKVQYRTADFKLRLQSFSGLTAQIIQHEIDHCNGILI